MSGVAGRPRVRLAERIGESEPRAVTVHLVPPKAVRELSGGRWGKDRLKGNRALRESEDPAAHVANGLIKVPIADSEDRVGHVRDRRVRGLQCHRPVQRLPKCPGVLRPESSRGALLSGPPNPSRSSRSAKICSPVTSRCGPSRTWHNSSRRRSLKTSKRRSNSRRKGTNWEPSLQGLPLRAIADSQDNCRLSGQFQSPCPLAVRTDLLFVRSRLWLCAQAGERVSLRAPA